MKPTISILAVMLFVFAGIVLGQTVQRRAIVTPASMPASVPGTMQTTEVPQTDIVAAPTPVPFTYQGKLADGSNTSPTAIYDMKFRLYSSDTGEQQLCGSGVPTLCEITFDDPGVSVNKGIFTVTLGFDTPSFTSLSGNYLEIAVRPHGSGSYTTLTPRQKISFAPYAIKSLDTVSLGGVTAENYVLTTDPRLSSPGNFIQNGTSPQTGDFNITGTGTVGGQLSAAGLNVTNNASVGGNLSVTGIVTGNGSGLTGILPGNISAGTAGINIAGFAAKTGTAASGETPDVTNLTFLKLNYASATTLTNLTGGVNGQCVTLLAANANVSVQVNNIMWIDGPWTPETGATLSVCQSDGLWYEKARTANGGHLTLTINANGGTVNGCSGTCVQSYTTGTTVLLTATVPNGGLMMWSGACSGNSLTCTVTMDSSKSVTANIGYTVTLSASNNFNTGESDWSTSPALLSCSSFDRGACSDSAVVPAGTSLQFLSDGNDIYDHSATFPSWGNNAGISTCQGVGLCTITVNQNILVQGVAAPGTYVSVTRSGTGSGTVTSADGHINCGATCVYAYAANASYVLTATPDTGSVFTGWSGPCTPSGNTCSGSTTVVANEITANFALVRDLTVTKTGSGTGTVTSTPSGIDCGATCSTSFVSGTMVTLTQSVFATNPSTRFVGWGGACSGTGSCTVTMDQARSVTARFEAPQVLTVTKAGTGTGTVISMPSGIVCGADCSSAFTYGQTVMLNYSAASGSGFAGWSGACSGTGTCTVTMNQARNVTATFNLN